MREGTSTIRFKTAVRTFSSGDCIRFKDFAVLENPAVTTGEVPLFQVMR
jgi:hypothetical protein